MTESHRRTAGFTLVDVGLALLCLGLALYVAVVEAGKLRHRMGRDSVVADLRQIAAAFETYHAQKGAWPAATTPEIRVPRGMESLLANTRWSTGTPFGGSFDWAPPARPRPESGEAAAKPAPPGMLAITAFSPGRPLALTRADLHHLDRQLDDGNLGTGLFQTGFNSWPVYHVTARR